MNTRAFGTRLTCVLVLVCLALTGVGCSSYSAPVLSIARAEPAERTPDGCSMVFVLDARNDNEDPLPLRTIEYRVDLNGREVFRGTRSAEATLRRLGTQQLRLPAALPVTPDTAGLLSGLVRYRVSGSIAYVTPGRLAETLFDAGVHVPSVAFDFEGNFDLGSAAFTPLPSPVVPKTTSAEPDPIGPASP